MKSKEIVEAMMRPVDEGRMEVAAGYLADDFVFSGPVPKPIGKEAWIDLQRRLLTAFPDWPFNLKKVLQGDPVVATYQTAGSHTGELDVSLLGLPRIPAAGQADRLSAEQARCKVRGGVIVRIGIDPNPESGLPGILGQLGVDMPKPPQ